MEKRIKGISDCSPERELQSNGLDSLVDQIRELAAYNARNNSNEKQLQLQLMSWWSRTYNRPLKDPLLLSYSLEELIYEYYDHIERDSAAEEIRSEETDRIEEAKIQVDEDWANEAELEDIENERRRLEAENNKKAPVDPSEDPANIKWMEEQIKKDKELHGENFGDDVKIEF